MQPSPLLHEATLEYLRQTKNLLAFSGGGDSTALFFLLLEYNIPFDIANVNYKTRIQSDEEEAYAQSLATKYSKQIFCHTCQISSSNFEHEARNARYAFFEEIIHTHHYEVMLTAHHLNDRLEWFLMQLTKGAGLVEMLGMSEMEQKASYALIRPLLHLPKKTLIDYLQERKITYFEDESNASLKHLRNHFRHHLSNPLMEHYAKGIERSFSYLEEDKKRLLPNQPQQIKELFLVPRNPDDLINIRQIDHIIKQLGLLLSKAQRDEILRTKACVVGGKIAICFEEKTIFIAPYRQISMDKAFKEACRKARIPAKIRPYCYQEKIDPTLSLFSSR